MVENVKFNHEFSLFFAQILLKNDTVYGYLLSVISVTKSGIYILIMAFEA